MPHGDHCGSDALLKPCCDPAVSCVRWACAARSCMAKGRRLQAIEAKLAESAEREAALLAQLKAGQAAREADAKAEAARRTQSAASEGGGPEKAAGR